MAGHDEHGWSPAPWSAMGIPASAGDGRLVRPAALTFLATVVILALYFGSAVLIPTAVACCSRSSSTPS